MCQNHGAILIELAKDTIWLGPTQKQLGTSRNLPPASRSWICLLQPFVGATSKIRGSVMVDAPLLRVVSGMKDLGQSFEQCNSHGAILIKIEKTENLAWPDAKAR